MAIGNFFPARDPNQFQRGLPTGTLPQQFAQQQQNISPVAQQIQPQQFQGQIEPAFNITAGPTSAAGVTTVGDPGAIVSRFQDVGGPPQGSYLNDRYPIFCHLLKNSSD